MGSTQLEIRHNTYISNMVNKKRSRTNLNSNCFSKAKQAQPPTLEGVRTHLTQTISRGLPLVTRIHPRILAWSLQECMRWNMGRNMPISMLIQILMEAMMQLGLRAILVITWKSWRQKTHTWFRVGDTQGRCHLKSTSKKTTMTLMASMRRTATKTKRTSDSSRDSPPRESPSNTTEATMAPTRALEQVSL